MSDTIESKISSIQKIGQIKERSEAVQEILSRTPGWIVRWGVSFFFLILLMLITGSYFIKYPDVITGVAVVTAEDPPVSLVARSSGKITELFVKDKQKVHKAEVLAVVENPADYPTVQNLKNNLSSFYRFFMADSIVDEKKFSVDHNSNLGDIEPLYSGFLQAFSDYSSFLKIDAHKHKIESLNKQLNNYQLLYARSAAQKQTSQEEFSLAKKKFAADSILGSNNAIAPMELNALRAVFLQKKNSFQAANTNLAQIQIQIGEIERNIQEAEMDFQQSKTRLVTSLLKSYEALMNQVATWEQTYLLISPIDGVIAFSNYWTKNQTVKSGEEVLTVAPEKASGLTARVKIPQRGSAKINAGQMVNIKLDNYPFEEYGMLVGKVSSVSLVPRDASYIVEVAFPNGLKTSYGKQLDFNSQKISSGTAEIVTKQRSLLERVFSKLESLLKRNVKGV